MWKRIEPKFTEKIARWPPPQNNRKRVKLSSMSETTKSNVGFVDYAFKISIMTTFLYALVQLYFIAQYVFHANSTYDGQKFADEVEAVVAPPNPNRLILGIFSERRMSSERKIIRETWMTLNGVCRNSIVLAPTCNIRVYFVVGNASSDPSIDEENKTYGDIVVLSMDSDIDEQKTYLWFQHLHLHHHSHENLFFGKANMDTFVDANKLSTELRSMTQRQLYAGRMVSFHMCGGQEKCSRPKLYMHGCFYIISRDLLDKIMDGGNEFINQNKNGADGLVIGRWLFSLQLPLNVYAWDNLGGINPKTPFKHEIANLADFYQLMPSK